MIVRRFVIATAGHIDHGKSALVRALTGTDPDRLPEEKSRGITIDLGFAELTLAAGDGSIIRAGLIDVPGHEDFVSNMIAGIGAVDLILLVVAADDGWMPQTEEHFQILSYFNVKRIVIAVTKCDASAPQNAIDQIREQLRESRYQAAPIVGVSSLTGMGIDDLRNTIALEMSHADASADIGKPRLHVDRAFSMRGAGSVITGTLVGGTFHEGQAVTVHPGGFSSRIRSLQNHGQTVKTAGPGIRAALNLTDVSVTPPGASVRRGSVISLAPFDAVRGIDVLLERSMRLRKTKPNAAAPLKHGANVYLHHGTSRLSAKVFLMETGELLAGDHALAHLRLERPMVAFLGDRFVLRDLSERTTMGGGIILDPEGNQRRFRTTSQKEFLAKRARNANDVHTAILTELMRAKAVVLNQASIKWPFSEKEVQQALEQLAAREEAVLRGEFAIEPGSWRDWLGDLTGLIDRQHAAHPEADGLSLVEMRTHWRNQPLLILDLLVDQLCQSGFVRRGDFISRCSHQPSLPPKLAATAQRMLALLSAKPFDPPGTRELLALPAGRESLSFLIGNGKVVEISLDLVLLENAFAQMRSAVRSFLEAKGQATVSELRLHLGTSRRVIVPLLEKLDKQKITRRSGDHRTLAH